MRLNRKAVLTLALAVFPIWTLQATASAAKTEKVSLEPGKTTIKWIGKKVTGQHDGTIKLQSGFVTLENNQLKGGEFVVDMKSLAVNDLQEAKSNAKLTGHLKSDDFFGVEAHPTSKLVITGVKPVSSPT